MKRIWTEAEPQRGWPQDRARDAWPSAGEYTALRQAKSNLDQGIANGWCQCGTVNCGGHHNDTDGWVAYFALGETHQGLIKWAGVRRARNRFGYESQIYVSACDPNGPRTSLMWWNGVPLRADLHEAEERIKVERRRVVREVNLPDVYVHGQPRDAHLHADPSRVHVHSYDEMPTHLRPLTLFGRRIRG